MKEATNKKMIVIAIIVSILITIIVLVTKKSVNSKLLAPSYDSIEVYADNVSSPKLAVMDSGIEMKKKEAIPVRNENIETTNTAKATSIEEKPNKKYEIKIANLDIEIEDLNDAVKKIIKISHKYNGNVVSSNIYPTNHYGNISIKVDVAKFTDAIDDIKKVALSVERESISSSDVTEQVLDLEQTIKNKKAQEEKLREFYSKATNIKDMLEIESRLSTLRNEIELLEARMKNTRNRTDFSTININLQETAKIMQSSENWNPIKTAKEAVNSLIKKTQQIVDGIIIFIISSLPVIFIYGIILIIVYIVAKRIFKKFANKDNSIK